MLIFIKKNSKFFVQYLENLFFPVAGFLCQPIFNYTQYRKIIIQLYFIAEKYFLFSFQVGRRTRGVDDPVSTRGGWPREHAGWMTQGACGF